uniref:Uncharacterized protein n=1 Tax=Pavo cristatus TaxID=9049 RepID=A0A8C9FNE8_PAVCR
MADGQAKSVCETWICPCTPGACEIRSLLPGNSKMQVKCRGTTRHLLKACGAQKKNGFAMSCSSLVIEKKMTRSPSAAHNRKKQLFCFTYS